MYKVVIKSEVYSEWECYQRPWHGVDFNTWVVDNYPEIVAVEWKDSVRWSTREFTFESEEMYHWFLLRQ